MLFIAAVATSCGKKSAESLTNFHIVRDSVLYRSAQLRTLEEWQLVYDLGIRRVLKLNYPDEDLRTA